MAESKRFYWIKLKESFLTSDTVDFLMSQKNGANYVVLYQMLCLKCANTNGELKRELGEIIIPYDEHKIQRDCKYFDLDTVIVALGLYKQLGLVYIQDDGYLKIANFDNLIGSESESAERVRRFREKKEVEKIPLQCNEQCNTNCNENVTVEKENRDRYKKENTPCGGTKEKAPRFSPPTLEDVQKYCQERKNKVDAIRFWNFYESKGWMVGKTKMKDWKASVRTWELEEKKKSIQGQRLSDHEERVYTKDELSTIVRSIDTFSEEDL